MAANGLWQTKPIEQSIADTDEAGSRLRRNLGTPLVPLLAILSCLWLMLNLSVGTWIRFLVWLVIGLIVYFSYGARKSRLRQGDRVRV
jgi:amino acid transporter